MKRVLLLTYYWPPMGGGGVQRWLKMSKYMADFGWNLTVYTADTDLGMTSDQSLEVQVPREVQVIRQPIVEPYELYSKFIGQQKGKSKYSGFIKEKKQSLRYKISLFIRSNFFIPDARKWWIRPSVSFLKKWLKDNEVDAIISNGPPHSMHVIALRLKETFPHIPWVADFRDPWTGIDFYDDLILLPFADRKHRKLEKAVLSKADKIVTVTFDLVKELSALADDRQVELILNGYDPQDFETFESTPIDKFIICHLGSMNKDRNPIVLWEAIQDYLSNKTVPELDLEVHLIGPIDYSVKEKLKEFGLAKNVKFIDFLPHDQAIEYLQKCSLLLLVINDSKNSKGILPGKLYEYLATQKPILAIGPKDGDIHQVLKEYDDCLLASVEDKTAIMNYLSHVIHNPSPPAKRNITQYSRRTHAQSFARLLDSLLR